MPQPQDRPDLDPYVPDEDDVQQLLQYVEDQLPAIQGRPIVQQLVAAHGLTAEELRMLICYKVEHPYPFYRWLNAWLGSSRRDPTVVEAVGPAFTLLYHALEKLPTVTTRAARAAVVHQIPALRRSFDTYTQRFQPGKRVAFWAFSSFSTSDTVMNSPQFLGQPTADAFVYQCGALTGVDMEPFKPDGMPSEEELLPLAPAVFVVNSASKVGNKVVIAIDQQPSPNLAYVPPRLGTSVGH
eukprot:NODE_542_length_1587_cov_5.625488_g393_i0.p1 GENE.NODE_542_length_1587_cov_5.625488_g393_i0~~NODE_542_length_1587_cov_5.625488_g393_i0.p1  ORF type:complete len:240 (+),score=64.23 NODE_542_length_1587_cov_5.625488_g393_i0:729-1448(+)